MDLLASLAGVLLSSSALLVVYFGMRWRRRARLRRQDKRERKQLRRTFE